MKNSEYEVIKKNFIDICEENNIYWTDALLYMIFSEYPIGVINEKLGDIEDIKQGMETDYDTLWEMQPAIEEDCDKAFAIQHARDIYDVLLNRQLNC